jgi:hypothetical protein
MIKYDNLSQDLLHVLYSCINYKTQTKTPSPQANKSQPFQFSGPTIFWVLILESRVFEIGFLFRFYNLFQIMQRVITTCHLQV